jgi:fatty acid synthase subunit alpha
VTIIQAKKSSIKKRNFIHDLESIEVSDSEVQKFKMYHGDRCDIWAGEGGQWFAKFKKGACVFVLKTFRFSRTVAGQIPTQTGWEAGRCGIPEDIIAQTDRATLWALSVVCTKEALKCIRNNGSVRVIQVHASIRSWDGNGMGGMTSSHCGHLSNV